MCRVLRTLTVVSTTLQVCVIVYRAATVAHVWLPTVHVLTITRQQTNLVNVLQILPESLSDLDSTMRLHDERRRVRKQLVLITSVSPEWLHAEQREAIDITWRVELVIAKRVPVRAYQNRKDVTMDSVSATRTLGALLRNVLQRKGRHSPCPGTDHRS